jgi:hypothetical protein
LIAGAERYYEKKFLAALQFILKPGRELIEKLEDLSKWPRMKGDKPLPAPCPSADIPHSSAREAIRAIRSLHTHSALRPRCASVMKHNTKINIIATMTAGILAAGALADAPEPAKPGAPGPGVPGDKPPQAAEPSAPSTDKPVAPLDPHSPQKPVTPGAQPTPGTPNGSDASAGPKNPESAPAK